MNKQAELNESLFEYLRQIIYTPETAFLDVASLPPEQKKLAQGLTVLLQFVLETRHLGEDLAGGVINGARLPSRENPFAGSLKAVHGTLQHLIGTVK